MRTAAIILTIWNVGQGQWITMRDSQSCRHFDLGGERKAVLADVLRHCDGLTNQIAITHWDLDHYGFLMRFKMRASNLCWLHKPPAAPDAISRKIQDIRNCASRGDLQILQKNSLLFSKRKNDLSQVFYDSKTRSLIPGDSPQKQEKIWLKALTAQLRPRILILGHHGSRTSTSKALLDRLPSLKMAVASQREKKYGHPHRETKEKLLRRHIPLLRTEDWGNLRFLFDP